MAERTTGHPVPRSALGWHPCWHWDNEVWSRAAMVKLNRSAYRESAWRENAHNASGKTEVHRVTRLPQAFKWLPSEQGHRTWQFSHAIHSTSWARIPSQVWGRSSRRLTGLSSQPAVPEPAGRAEMCSRQPCCAAGSGPPGEERDTAAAESVSP